MHADVDSIAALVSTNQKLKDLLFNPVVEADKKKAVVAKISKEAGFQKYTTNFLNLLVEKDRVNLLNEICESFEEQYCQLTDTQVRTGVLLLQPVTEGGFSQQQQQPHSSTAAAAAAAGGRLLQAAPAMAALPLPTAAMQQLNKARQKAAVAVVCTAFRAAAVATQQSACLRLQDGRATHVVNQEAVVLAVLWRSFLTQQIQGADSQLFSQRSVAIGDWSNYIDFCQHQQPQAFDGIQPLEAGASDQSLLIKQQCQSLLMLAYY